MKNPDIVKMKYIEGYVLELLFSDGIIKVIDFGKYLSKNSHPQFDKYKDYDSFQTFKLEMGNVVWGENWDLVFPPEKLYMGKFQ